MLRFAMLRTASEHFLQLAKESAFVVMALQAWAVLFSWGHLICCEILVYLE